MIDITVLLVDLSPITDTAEKVKSDVESKTNSSVKNVMLFDRPSGERIAVVTYALSPAAKSLKLSENLDSYIPEPERDIDKPFLMPIEDVFSISGR